MPSVFDHYLQKKSARGADYLLADRGILEDRALSTGKCKAFQIVGPNTEYYKALRCSQRKVLLLSRV